MGKDSKIEWCDHTFNPWVGCQKVGPGCQFCYAEKEMTRKTRWANAWGPPEASERIKTKTWAQPLTWDRKATEAGRRDRVFCASLADIFEHNPQVGDWRLELWDLIEKTTSLIWLLLTKRPENVLDFVPELWKHGMWPDHVWIGVSVENQEMADRRIPELLRIPAGGRFLSIEPMLDPINIEHFLLTAPLCLECQSLLRNRSAIWPSDGPDQPCPECNGQGYRFEPAISWVIVGGESGPNGRPMHPDWPRGIRDQCLLRGIPFFFKQWGAWVASHHASCSFEDWQKAPKHLMSPLGPAGFVPTELMGAGDILMAKVGKKKTGHLLDGVAHFEIPQSMR